LKTDVDKLSSAVNKNIASICGKKGHKDIKIYNKKNKKYEVSSINNLGKIRNIAVGKKASGGVVSKLNISGSKKKIEVINQYTIRRVLAGVDGTLKNNKGKSIKLMNMLPSGYFTIKKSGKKIIIDGGGYGHGVGLSQWGAAKLAEEGYKYDDILRYYFNGIDIDKDCVVKK
jgi:stage II sporulation protein D